MNNLYGQAVLPMEILNAREKRAVRQQAMLAHGGSCLISFTLNIAGPIKINHLIKKSFDEGIQEIERQLKRHQITILQQKIWVEKTGCEAMFAVNFDALRIKAMMTKIEEESKLGRLFDIDVICKETGHISRSLLGFESRRCLICQRPAHECSRSQRHDSNIIFEESERIMREYFLNKKADLVAAMACRSMLYEVCVTPKPGLVDRNNSGAHEDMDIFTFMDSVAVLTPHFRRLFLRGYELKTTAPQHLLERLRFAGLQAEYDMLAATNRVNTHKGLIFSLGILCSALGWSEANNHPVNTESILSLCGEIARPSLESDLQNITADEADTAGKRLYVATGNTGVRGEAAAGFPAVMHCGLPVMRKCIAEGKSLNDAGVYTLLALMGKAVDTNIIARCGLRTQQKVQESMQALLREKPFPDIEEIKGIDRQYIKENISPGGCADLLALTYMLYFLEESQTGNYGNN